MTSPVKTRSQHRQRQAEQTRERILDAARLRFSQDGYGATSIDAIAATAGVGVRTVYAVFGNKRELLSALCERWLEQAQARERFQQVLAEPDTERRLDLAADWLTRLYATDFEVVLILDAATDEDAETRELLQAKLAGRNEVMNAMIASLEDALAVPLEDAQAMFRAFAAGGVYRELVRDSGWSPDRFSRWVAASLRADLLEGGRQPRVSLR